MGVRSGDKGRGKEGEELGNFEPGADIKAKATVLAEGCWGHLTGPAIREFDLGEDREPQTWELGVKEVWKVKEPLDRVIHTIGPWPVSTARQVRPGGRHLDLPDEGREDRRRPGLDRLRDRPRVRRRHHLLPRPAADLQDPPAGQEDPRGRRARVLGRQGAAGRRLLVDAQALDARRRAGGRLGRHGRHGGAEGRAPLDQLRHPRRRGDLQGPQGGDQRLLLLRGRDRGVADRQGALRGAQHAPAVLEGLLHRRRRS